MMSLTLKIYHLTYVHSQISILVIPTLFAVD